MSKKGIFVVIIYLIFAFSVICWIFVTLKPNTEAAIAVAVFVLVPIGAYLFKPIRNELDSFISNLFVDKSIYRILIFGRPGSGKTTFIETAFTLIDPDIKRESTPKFESYKYKISLEKKSNFVNLAVADYQGQNPLEVILYAKPDFFGSQGRRVLNAIVFIVDLVPRKKDEHGELLNDEALREWLKNGDGINKIETRVQEHYDYINEISLHLIFGSLHSKNLKSVMLLINKLDLIEKLIDDGYITLPNFPNAKEYAKFKFERMISNISRVCSELNIEDFSKDYSVFTVSAKKTDDLKPLIVHLLRKRN